MQCAGGYGAPLASLTKLPDVSTSSGISTAAAAEAVSDEVPESTAAAAAASALTDSRGLPSVHGHASSVSDGRHTATAAGGGSRVQRRASVQSSSSRAVESTSNSNIELSGEQTRAQSDGRLRGTVISCSRAAAASQRRVKR